MELKPGYKMTEVGVIPEDWNCRLLGELITRCFTGATPRRDHPEFFRGNIRWITSGELKYNVIEDTVEKISAEAVDKANLTIVPEGTLLIAITGLEAEGTRGACGIVGAPSATNQSCMAIFPTAELATPYLFHYYVFRGKSLALRYCQGTKQQSYTAGLVKQLPIAVPRTITEQSAIAATLSDVDALLSALEKLLIKKRALKQAAMQQLLTGKTRLPGFEGEWEERPFNAVFTRVNVKAFQVPASRYLDTGTVPVIDQSQQNVAGFVDEDICRFIPPAQGVIVFGDHTCAVKFVAYPCVFGADGTQVMTTKSDICTHFAYYLLVTNGVESTGYNRHFGVLQTRKFKVPKSSEQRAIASVLSDMDAEIKALEARLEKTRALKQGMMQDLLTGRVRLI